MNAAKQLRQKILDLAIRGLLVPQNPKDEPAEKLLQRIWEEKLNAEEQRSRGRACRSATAAPQPIPDDEKPFDLPKGWAWCRLGEIGCWKAGATPLRSNPDYYRNGNIPWLKTGDLNDGVVTEIPERITKKGLDSTPAQINPKGTVLMAMYGATIGKVGILDIDAATNQACCACDAVAVDRWYLFYYLLSQREEFKSLGGGGAQPNISKDIIVKHLIPLPPLAEQKRIVAKVEALLKDVEKYERAVEGLTGVADDLSKKILDLAIRGQLTKRDPKDEPAEKLLARIWEEKLNAEEQRSRGRARRAATAVPHSTRPPRSTRLTQSPPIPDDEKPFPLPKGWAWCRLGDVFDINPRNEAKDNVDASFLPMARLSEGYGSVIKPEIKKWGTIKKGYTHFKDGDVVFAKISPCMENRKSAVVHGLCNGIGAGTTELTVFRIVDQTVIPEYLLFFLKSEILIKSCATTFSGCVGQQRVNPQYLRDHPFPLPPLAEQKRIVAKVEELLSEIERLKKGAA